MRHHQLSEDEKLRKAKRQLLIVGVSCVAVVVFALWLVSLHRTLAGNSLRYRAPHSSFQAAQGQLGSAWEQFRSQLDGLRK